MDTTFGYLRLVDEACRWPYASDQEEKVYKVIEYLGQHPELCREASISMLKYIKPKNFSVAMNTLALVDLCAIHLGFPFQYAISRKDFVLELIKKTSKPKKNGLVDELTEKILQLVYKWYEALARHQDPSYREDFKNLKEAYIYLQSKGFVMPTYIPPEEIQALRPHRGLLQTTDEIAKENRLILDVKLHESIRQKDPKEANLLLRTFTGYDRDQSEPLVSEQYRVQFLGRLAALKNEATAWLDMLHDSYDPDVSGGYSDDLREIFDENMARFKAVIMKIQDILSAETPSSALTSDAVTDQEIENIELMDTYEVLCEAIDFYQNPLRLYQRSLAPSEEFHKEVDDLLHLDDDDDDGDDDDDDAKASSAFNCSRINGTGFSPVNRTSGEPSNLLDSL